MQQINQKDRINYIFIDYENVQPSKIRLPKNIRAMVLLFIGPKQSKIPVDLAISMQKLGKDAEYIKVDTVGKNALDFILAYYLGEMTSRDHDGYFHLITKDTGFDPMIAHLKKRGLTVSRHEAFEEIPILKSEEMRERLDRIIRFLYMKGETKPKKIEKLSNAINSIFLNSLSDTELNLLIKELMKKNLIVAREGKISYNLPHSQVATKSVAA